MSGAIVTMAQMAAARAAARREHHDRGRVHVDELGGAAAGGRHPPRAAGSPSVRYGGMSSPMGTVERRGCASRRRRPSRSSAPSSASSWRSGCSSPRTGRCRGRPPPSWLRSCSIRWSTAWPCASAACPPCSSPSRPSAPSPSAPPTSCSTRWSRPSTGWRRRRRRRPSPSRTARPGRGAGPGLRAQRPRHRRRSTRSMTG